MASTRNWPRVLRQAQTDFRIAAAIQVGDFGFYKDLMAQAREERTPLPRPAARD